MGDLTELRAKPDYESLPNIWIMGRVGGIML